MISGLWTMPEPAAGIIASPHHLQWKPDRKRLSKLNHLSNTKPPIRKANSECRGSSVQAAGETTFVSVTNSVGREAGCKIRARRCILKLQKPALWTYHLHVRLGNRMVLRVRALHRKLFGQKSIPECGSDAQRTARCIIPDQTIFSDVCLISCSMTARYRQRAGGAWLSGRRQEFKCF